MSYCKQGIVSKSRFDKRTNKHYDRSYFRTRTLPLFRSLQELWYPNKNKIIPKNFILTPLTIANWILDDGHFEKVKNSKILKLHIATNSFHKNEVFNLRQILNERYNCQFTISKITEEQFCIVGSNLPTRLLLREIDKEIPLNVMKRKTQNLA